GERSPAVIQASCLKTVPTAGQNGNPGPRAGALRAGEERKRESLLRHCRQTARADHPLREESLRAGPVSIILLVFSQLSRWAEIACLCRHIGVSSVCHEARG